MYAHCAKMKVGSLRASPRLASASAFSREKIENVRVSRCYRRGARTREIDRHRASSSTNELESHTTLSRGVMSSSCMCNHRLGRSNALLVSPVALSRTHPSPSSHSNASSPRARASHPRRRALPRDKKIRDTGNPAAARPALDAARGAASGRYDPCAGAKRARVTSIVCSHRRARLLTERTRWTTAARARALNARSNPSTWRSRRRRTSSRSG